jgi:predicted negative regulator of RcsB-dependent stress response
MAKLTPRRRSALDNPEEVLNLAQRLLQQVKPYTTWLVVAGAVIVVALAAWGINARMDAGRQDKAAAAFAVLTPKADLKTPDPAAAQALEKFINEYRGTRAAREAQLQRANLLYRLARYPEAATAYESLLNSGDPGWDALVNESLSYCYEGMGDFKKAAAVLKPVVEHTSGAMQSEVMRRQAMLYEQAKEPKEAAALWTKLLDRQPNPDMVPYLREKLAAAEAAGKK